MNKDELNDKAKDIKRKMIAGESCDNEVFHEMNLHPELANIILPASTNLFIEAVNYNYINIAKKLMEYDSDIHLCCKASLIHGNVLNVAKTPEMAEWLLSCGIEIEKNLKIAGLLVNPAIHAVMMNKIDMAFYWLNKEKELFPDEQYIMELFNETIKCATMLNQVDMITRIMKDDKLYEILKSTYAQVMNEASIKLRLQTLRRIKDKELQSKKKELKSILQAQK